MDSVGFALIVAANAALFLRPAELVPALEGVPVYQILILSCLAVSLPTLARQVGPRSLFAQPITGCVVGLLPGVMMAYLARFETFEARTAGADFFRVVLYYVLLVALLDGAARLRLFLRWVVAFAAVLTALAVLHYHGAINIPSLDALDRAEVDARTGELYTIRQLRGTGIFHDPNDLCLVLVVAMSVCLYEMTGRGPRLLRAAWLGPTALFLYALGLTYSRGGLLAFLVGLMVYAPLRFGWRRTLPLLVLGMPALLFLFGGRQTAISTEEGTAQQRIKLWSEGLVLLRYQGPLFGIGHSRYAEEMGHVAHNSFVNSYTELGLFGGTLFLGAFYLALTGVHRLGSRRVPIADPELRRLRPCLLALVGGYSAGMFSLSRAYIEPTYMVLALAAAYIRAAGVHAPAAVPRLDGRQVLRVCGVSAAALVGIHLFIRVFARWG